MENTQVRLITSTYIHSSFHRTSIERVTWGQQTTTLTSIPSKCIRYCNIPDLHYIPQDNAIALVYYRNLITSNSSNIPPMRYLETAAAFQNNSQSYTYIDMHIYALLIYNHMHNVVTKNLFGLLTKTTRYQVLTVNKKGCLGRNMNTFVQLDHPKYASI